MTLRVLAGVLLSLCLTSVALAAPLTEAEREAELQKLQWIEAPGSYALTQSKSHLEVVQGQVLLLGSDAAGGESGDSECDQDAAHAADLGLVTHELTIFQLPSGWRQAVP